MLKSLMLATACAYINPPGLEQAPVVQATPVEILKQAYAMVPGTQKAIVIDHGDGLCSKVVIEPTTDEELKAFIDWAAAKNFAVPLPRPRPADAPKLVAECPKPTSEADADCHNADVSGK